MNPLASRAGRVAVTCLVQLALVPLAVAGPLSARLTGEEYLLEVAPLDPVDPFRGTYVALSYPGLPSSHELTERQDSTGDVAYVPLVRSGSYWVGREAVAERPETGPFLRCEDEHWRLRCGIDSFFLPQDKALAMEQAVSAGRAVARVRIDSRGNAALVDVASTPMSP
jgi:uncharacterized membrane-anchored protein